MTVLVEHGPWLEDHDSQAKLTLSIAAFEPIRLVVSSEVALEAKAKRDLLVEFVILHLVKVSLAELCILEEPLVGLLVFFLPLAVTQKLFEVVGVEHHGSCDEIGIVG